MELISLERFTNAYGLLLLVQGIANLIGPPLAGWITDLTGNYDLAFYLAGAFIVASGTLMMLLPVRGKIRKYRRYRRQGRSSGEESSSTDDEEADIEKCLSPIKEEVRVGPTFFFMLYSSISAIFQRMLFDAIFAGAEITATLQRHTTQKR